MLAKVLEKMIHHFIASLFLSVIVAVYLQCKLYYCAILVLIISLLLVFKVKKTVHLNMAAASPSVKRYSGLHPVTPMCASLSLQHSTLKRRCNFLSPLEHNHCRLTGEL